jgi:hypothetical protein
MGTVKSKRGLRLDKHNANVSAKNARIKSGMVPEKIKTTGRFMANYDTPTVFYDSGVLYDTPDLPEPPKKRMAKVKLNIKSLPDAQIIQQCTNIKTAMTGNANFTTPVPALAAFTTLINTAQTKLTASENAQTAAKQATADKDTAIVALLAAATQLATYVDLTANGDEAKILSAGMQVRATATPSTPPATVMDLFITAGDSAGEVDLQWDPVNSAKSYEVQTSPEPMTASSWSPQATVTKSRTAVTGLTSGQRVWARVRAVNPAGLGPWSDPATKIVP